MPRTPSREQQAAIEANNPTILVSAAAGSGKTYVLIERIVRLLREGGHLNRMLIMTFTQAAAGEMRERLNDRLRAERMHAALEELEDTQIGTIHAYCQKLLRQEFQEAGLDPAFRVGDSASCHAMRREAFRLALNALLEEEGETDLRFLAEAFGAERLEEAANRVYDFLLSMPDPFGWLNHQIDLAENTPTLETAWYQALREQAALYMDGIFTLLQAQEEMFHVEHAVDALWEVYLKDLSYAEALRAALHQGTEALYQVMMELDFASSLPRLQRGATQEQKDWKDAYKNLRDQMIDLRDEIRSHLLLNPEKFHVEHLTDLRFQRGMQNLLQRFHNLYREIKRRADVIDFSDMEQLADELLQSPDIAEKQRGAYDHIFVDECQDVSGIQDHIIQQIHDWRNCLFMVGDVKQSIYRFRLADPTIFLERLQTYKDDTDAPERRILLSTNYRSTASVLEACNEVFAQLMQPSVTELTYGEADALRPSPFAEEGEPAQLLLLHQPESDEEEDEEERSTLERETDAIIRQIRELRQTPHSIQRNGQTLVENYRYRDMVILLPKLRNHGRRMADRLQQAGIPVFIDERGGYFELIEVQRMLMLLSLLDNPLQDEALLTVCKMPPFRFTDEELGEIRLCAPEREVPFYTAFQRCQEGDHPLAQRCRQLSETLETWGFWKETMSLGDLLRRLLRETGYEALCGAMPEGELRQANLRLLCQYASDYEQWGRGGISGFLEMVGNLRQIGDGNAARLLGEQEDVVRIMTMHKSKGLEFPVVFLGMISSSRGAQQDSTVRFHRRLGLTFPYVHTEYSIERKTPVMAAFDFQRTLDELAEKARLLYVAMTRARERLILIGSPSETDGQRWAMPATPYRIWAAKTMLNWVMQTQTPDATPHWKILPEAPLALREEAAEPGKTLQAYLQQVLRQPGNPDLFQEEAETLQPPLKTSVTSLTKGKLTPTLPTEEEEDGALKREPERILQPLQLGELPRRPAFMEEHSLTAAERGTQTHRLLSLLPLEFFRELPTTRVAYREALQRAVLQLQQEGKLTPEEASSLHPEWITGFLLSRVGQKALHSGTLRREWSFNLRLSSGTLLQGVIDCAFIHQGAWVVVDYKTDWVEDEAVFQARYQEQLSWYAAALERITGIPVQSCVLFSLRLGKAYDIDRLMQLP